MPSTRRSRCRGSRLVAQKPANDESLATDTGGNDVAVGLDDDSAESGIGRRDIRQESAIPKSGIESSGRSQARQSIRSDRTGRGKMCLAAHYDNVSIRCNRQPLDHGLDFGPAREDKVEARVGEGRVGTAGFREALHFNGRVVTARFLANEQVECVEIIAVRLENVGCGTRRTAWIAGDDRCRGDRG